MSRTKTTTENTTVMPEEKNRTKTVVIVLSILLFLALAIAGYFFYQFKFASPVSGEDEITRLTKTLGEMIVLPEGETPTLATVTDKEKLADQPFFQKADNGDKVLIYSLSGKAILYRPSTEKIVDITTINVNQPAVAPKEPAAAPVSQPTATEASKVTATLYNGSAKIGVTNKLEDEIEAEFSNIDVIAKETAAKNDYQGNLIIDLSGRNAEMAKKLAESYSGTVGTMPGGEALPVDTDILFIVGNKPAL